MALRKKFRDELAAWHGPVAWVYFFALATAPVVFVAVAWIQVAPAPGSLTPPAGARSMPVFATVMSTVALLAAAAGVAVRRLATPERLARSALRISRTPSPLPPESEEERRLAAAVQRYQMILILSLALLESASIMGFVLSFLSLDLTWVVAFSAVAVTIDIVLLRPDPGIYERLARAVRAP